MGNSSLQPVLYRSRDLPRYMAGRHTSRSYVNGYHYYTGFASQAGSISARTSSVPTQCSGRRRSSARTTVFRHETAPTDIIAKGIHDELASGLAVLLQSCEPSHSTAEESTSDQGTTTSRIVCLGSAEGRAGKGMGRKRALQKTVVGCHG